MKQVIERKTISSINKVTSNEKGLTLIEVLVALAIMSFVAVTFIVGLGVSINTSTINKDSIDAEELAKYQMEFIKAQDYKETNPPVYQMTTAPSGYYISGLAERMDPKGDGTATDDGIQRITIRVYKGADTNGPLLMEFVGYKVK
jgi:prepilin-type N-terminal cleavage/methylation domain-containing protein